MSKEQRNQSLVGEEKWRVWAKSSFSFLSIYFFISWCLQYTMSTFFVGVGVCTNTSYPFFHSLSLLFLIAFSSEKDLSP